MATEHLTRRQRAELRDTYEATVPATIAAEEWSPPPPLAADLDDITAEIAHNTTALVLATDTEVVPDAAAILQMHRTLLAEVDPDAGHWRTHQVRVGGSDIGPFGASHVAPVHERAPGLVEDLTTYRGGRPGQAAHTTGCGPEIRPKRRTSGLKTVICGPGHHPAPSG